MCKLKSGLLFKNGVFVPDYDSHDKMLTEKGIEDTAENRIAGKFVRFELSPENDDPFVPVPFPVSWTVKMKKKQKETQDILSYHTQAAGCSDKARAKASGGRQPIEECGRTGL